MMKKQYKLELRVGDYLLDRGMKVEINLQQHLSHQHATAVAYHLEVVSDIISKYVEKPNE
jgi:hypothetical protein